MKAILFSIVIMLGSARLVTAGDKRPHGTYSNNAEGFYTATICLRDDGKGLYTAGLAPTPILWTYAPDTATITVTGNLAANLRVASRTLRYDPVTDTIYIDAEARLQENHRKLKQVSESIHPALLKVLDTFDWDFTHHEIHQ